MKWIPTGLGMEKHSQSPQLQGARRKQQSPRLSAPLHGGRPAGDAKEDEVAEAELNEEPAPPSSTAKRGVGDRERAKERRLGDERLEVGEVERIGHPCRPFCWNWTSDYFVL